MLKNASLLAMTIGLTSSFLLVGCASEQEVADAPDQADSSVSATTDAQEFGELEIRANGEDFVREGFVSKDDWQINFDHLYVTLSEVTAYQSDPPFSPDTDEQPQAKTIISTDEPITVDLAAGDEVAEPILVETLVAPAGRYNALSWQMTPAITGPAEGYPLVLQGQASKAGETVNFILKLESTLGFVCGDYVGDERKGILAANDQADLEATFHFDHLFGSSDVPASDEINTKALGFDPLAAIAEGGTLEVDTQELELRLSSADYALLMSILPSLGHVGEGHCQETELTNLE